MILALTSRHLRPAAGCTTPPRRILQQKLSQVEGVGQVIVGGGALPAVRVERQSDRAEQLRARPGGRPHRARQRQRQPAQGPARPTARTAWAISANDQLLKADEYRPLIVAYRNGAPVRLARRRRPSTTRSRTSATAACRTASRRCSLIIFRQPGANIIETVDRVRALLPQLQAVDPAGDRPRRSCSTARPTIRASLHDVELTLLHLDRAGDPGGLRVPAQRARDAHPQRRRAGLADRHLRRHVPAAATASTTSR